MKSHITKITIERLYNLGSYEHIRYGLSIEVEEGASATLALLGAEKLLAALNPKTATHSHHELNREQRSINEMIKMLAEQGEEKFRARYGHYEGTADEYIERCQQSHNESVKRRAKWEAKQVRARKMLDDLGGAAEWRDAKLDWEDGYEY